MRCFRSDHVTTLQHKCHDQPQHIAQSLQGGELPVGAVATVAHCPDEEGRWHTWPYRDSGEAKAVPERVNVALHRVIGRGQFEGGDIGTVTERISPDAGYRIGECEGGDSTATIERTGANTC